MTLYEFKEDGIAEVLRTTFGALKLKERADLQRLLRDKIEAVCPDTMVLAEEFGNWVESRRRIDLLCLDKEARLVVVELKRGEDGDHMELQAIRYGAMVSTMTFAQAVHAHAHYLRQRGSEADAEGAILRFLDWEEPDEDTFASDVRIVLVSADFSRELTTSVLWLAGFDVDIRCVRIRPYSLDGRVLVDVQTIVPLPEATEYMESVREKGRAERENRASARDYTRFNVTVAGETSERLAKRKAIFLVIHRLCRSGVSPDEVAQALPWKKRLWRIVEGQVGHEAFIDAAMRDAEAGGLAFDTRRWFCADDELIHWEGRTFAVTNQWGGKTREAIGLLLERWPDRGLSYEVAESGGS